MYLLACKAPTAALSNICTRQRHNLGNKGQREGEGKPTNRRPTRGGGRPPNKGRRGNQAPPQAIAAPLGRAAATSKQRHKEEQRPPRDNADRNKQKTRAGEGEGASPQTTSPIEPRSNLVQRVISIYRNDCLAIEFKSTCLGQFAYNA